MKKGLVGGRRNEKATAKSKERNLRNIRSKLQYVIDQAQSALGNFNDGDYDGAVAELGGAHDDSDYLMSEIEALAETENA